MGGQHDPLVGGAGQFRDHIAGSALILLLLQLDGSPLGTCRDQLHRILGIDVHTGDLVALVHIAAQLPLVDITVGVIAVAVVGNEAHRAVFQDVLIQPVAQVAVHQNDPATAICQRLAGLVGQIIQLRFQIGTAAV